MESVRPAQAVINIAVKPIGALGAYVLFFWESFKRCFYPPVRFKLLVRQMEFVGNRSLSITILSAIMIGSIFGLILGSMFQTLGIKSMLGAAAAISITKELAPIFCGFIVTARAGSAMAAEIATMRVNEQIDAMRVMAVNPYGYLVAPRLLASVLMMPLLAAIFMLVGIFSAFVMGKIFYDVDPGIFVEKMRMLTKPIYIYEGLEKAALFGAVIATLGCFKGFFATGGAKGVGRATTEAVVLSLVTILVLDFFVAYLHYQKPL